MKKKSKRWIGMEAKHEQNQTLNKIPPERQVMIGACAKERRGILLCCYASAME